MIHGLAEEGQGFGFQAQKKAAKPRSQGRAQESWGGAPLFTVGAAERCPEERQQLTGQRKKMASFHKEPFKSVFRATLRVNV